MITIPEKILEYLKSQEVFLKKDIICRDLDLRRASVNYGCRILRKKNLIGWCYRKYWGVK